MNQQTSKYASMTGNERLAAAGLTKKWEQAVRRTDKAAMVKLLLSVEYSEEGAGKAVRAAITHARKFGG